MTPKNLELLKAELIVDECHPKLDRRKIYLDTMGHPTVGIGHLIKKTDKCFGWPVGSMVTMTDVDMWFAQDVDIAIRDAKKFLPEFDKMPDEVQRVVVNMAFNLGYPRLSKFVKFRSALHKRDWSTAEFQMRSSKWAAQVKSRAVRLCALMRKAAP